MTAVALGVGLLLSACAMPMASHQPSMSNIERLRKPETPKLTVGDFRLEPGKPAAMDRAVNIRGSTLVSPDGKSYALFLKETLATELRAAGKLDTAGAIVVSGLLNESRVDAAMSVGTASLGAIFIVTRDGREVYRKALRVEATWTSNFIGAVAIPMAMNQYTALYSDLVGKLLDDPDFQAAVRATSA